MQHNSTEKSQTIVESAIKGIKEADFSLVSKLINEGLDPNSKNNDGISLLHLAVKSQEPKMVKLLLLKGANPNITSPEKENVIVGSQLNPYTEKSFVINDLTPLQTALCDDIGSKLFSFRNEHHSQKNSTNPKPTLKQILENKLAIVGLLLAYKSDVNIQDKKYGLSPLHLATNHSWPSIVKKLIANGADVNSKAFTNFKSEAYFIRDFTPLMMATCNYTNSKASQCISMLIQAGAKPYKGKEDGYVPTKILKILAEKYPRLSTDILETSIRKESLKLQKEHSKYVLKEFLRNASKINDSKIVAQYVSEMLHPNAIQNSKKNDATYFAHLNSWVGNVTYLGENNYPKQTSSEGWEHIIGIPIKLRNLMLTMNKIVTGKLDCVEKFDEPKHQVLSKLKNEILNMANAYYTLKHAIMIGEFQLPDNKNSQKQKGFLADVEALKWCNEINKLKTGETFSIGCGNLNHAIYIDYFKQENNKISKIIYNLGGGSQSHTKDENGRLYPYVITNIPSEKFKTFDKDIINDLSKIILEVGKPHYDFSLRNNIYASPSSTPKKVLVDNDFKKTDFIPMKPQIAGNCTVKNLNSGILNRIKNKKLYKYIKNFEMEKLQNNIKLTEKVVQQKELQKDIQNFEVMLGHIHRRNPATCENEIFNFLRKRTFYQTKQYSSKEGDRIAEVIKDLKNPEMFKSYLTKSNLFRDLLVNIATNYQSKTLKNTIDEVNKEKFSQPTLV